MKKWNSYISSITHSDIFSLDILIQKAATSYFKKILKVRVKFLNQNNSAATPPASGFLHGSNVQQGIVDGSESKPALRQDSGYMVEKTCNNIAPYLGAFGGYLMHQ